MLRHLKVYKIRRKVTMNLCPDLSLWAVLPWGKETGEILAKPDISSPEKALVWEADARTEAMGWRLVMDNNIDPLNIIASCRQGDTEDYHRHRYAIGKIKLICIAISNEGETCGFSFLVHTPTLYN